MTYVGYFDHPTWFPSSKKKMVLIKPYENIWHINWLQNFVKIKNIWITELRRLTLSHDDFQTVSYRQIVCPRCLICSMSAEAYHFPRELDIISHLISTTWLCPEDVSDSWRFYLFIRLFTNNFYTSSIIQEISPVPAFGRHLGSCNRFKKKRNPWLDSQRWVSSTKKGEQLEEVQVSSSLLIGPKNW